MRRGAPRARAQAGGEREGTAAAAGEARGEGSFSGGSGVGMERGERESAVGARSIELSSRHRVPLSLAVPALPRWAKLQGEDDRGPPRGGEGGFALGGFRQSARAAPRRVAGPRAQRSSDRRGRTVRLGRKKERRQSQRGWREGTRREGAGRGARRMCACAKREGSKAEVRLRREGGGQGGGALAGDGRGAGKARRQGGGTGCDRVGFRSSGGANEARGPAGAAAKSVASEGKGKGKGRGEGAGVGWGLGREGYRTLRWEGRGVRGVQVWQSEAAARSLRGGSTRPGGRGGGRRRRRRRQRDEVARWRRRRRGEGQRRGSRCGPRCSPFRFAPLRFEGRGKSRPWAPPSPRVRAAGS